MTHKSELAEVQDRENRNILPMDNISCRAFCHERKVIWAHKLRPAFNDANKAISKRFAL